MGTHGKKRQPTTIPKGSQQPSLPASIVEQLREANPYTGEINFTEDKRIGYEKGCDTLEQLIGKQGEERRLNRQEDNNELLAKCLKMLKYLYMNEYCGEHGNEVRELIKPKPHRK